MLNLSSTTDTIEVVTGSAVTGQDVHASWVDLDTATNGVQPGRTNTAQITTATTTTVVASPGNATTTRNVKFLSIRNIHATSSVAITVQHKTTATTTQLIKLTLLAGYEITYNDGDGWVLIDASGGRVESPLTGRFLGSSVLTSASANFTTGPSTNTIFIRGVAGGGGGAGCTSVAAAAAAGGGGGAGGYLEKTVAVSPNTAYAYTCGAAGTGVSGAAGNNGGDSTFVVGATTYTAKGGTGAVVATAATTLTARAGGTGGVVSINGDLNSAGQPGTYGVVLIVATPIVASGKGGNSPFGAGGVGITAVGNGNAGIGFGSGGGGSATGASTVRTGGNGTAGCWIVDEYS